MESFLKKISRNFWQYFWGLFFSIYLQYELYKNYEFVAAYLDKDTVVTILNLIVAINAAILVFYSIVPKCDSENMKTLLMNLQQKQMELIDVKQCFDSYSQLYRKMNNEMFVKVKFLHMFMLAMFLIQIYFFMVASHIHFIIQGIALIIIFMICLLIEEIIDDYHYEMRALLPHPDMLLVPSNQINFMRNIDIKFENNITSHIFSNATLIRVMDVSTCVFNGLEDADAYSNYFVINFALEFNLKNVTLEYYTANGRREVLNLHKAPVRYHRINPTIDVLLTKEKALAENPKFTFNIRKSDGTIEYWICNKDVGDTYKPRLLLTQCFDVFRDWDEKDYLIH